MKNMDIDPVSLTQKLIGINTVNGNETECSKFIGDILKDAGFKTEYHDLAPGRANLIARLSGKQGKLPICFSGHVDVVPFGDAQWKRNPASGEIHGDKLYGRGASDMKAGVAAMVVAALRVSQIDNREAGLKLVITAGEENACEGANILVEKKVLGKAGALVIGEPTSNYPMIGHKGALWLKMTAKGKTAHGSMPEKGVNAIYKAAEAILKLRDYKFKCAPNPVLGMPTLNTGKIEGGINYNLVPDHTAFYVDIRTIPEQNNQELIDDLREYLGKDIEIVPTVNASGIFSDPENDWIQEVFKIMTPCLKEPPTPKGVTYFTDASALREAFGAPPTVALGPGEAAQCHQTDEFCYINKIYEATDAYTQIATRWVS